MDNNLIHVGFDKADIRDFISKSFIRLSNEERETYTQFSERYDGQCHILEFSLRRGEFELKQNKKRVEILKQRLSLITILDMFKWGDHDVSEYTKRDNLNDDWMLFIGTEEEYADLITSIDKKGERHNYVD